MTADVHQCDGGIIIVDADRTTAEVCADVADREAQFDELQATGGIMHSCNIDGEIIQIRSKKNKETTCAAAKERARQAEILFQDKQGSND